jgi:hypothetical protein
MGRWEGENGGAIVLATELGADTIIIDEKLGFQDY